MYTQLQPIRPYVAPQYLVEPIGPALTDPEEIDAELDAAEYKGAGPTTIETDLIGWGPYTDLIVCVDEHDEERYYLAV